MKFDENKVKQLIAKHYGIDIGAIKNESKFLDDLGGDSLDTVELVLEFEDEFDIEIPESVVETLSTVQDLLNYLRSVLE